MRHVRYITGIISITLLLNISGCIGDGCCSTKATVTTEQAVKNV